MNRYALIKGEVVDNVVLWDGDETRWTPPQDVTLVMVDDGWGFGVGDLYIDGVFYRPVPPEPTVDADGYMVQNGVRMTDENGQWITAESYYA
ncbi:MAG: hypothetical protein EHM43_11670 [Ignavibacteriae bacterium]|nr:MAG: hypothetical protein EHM43_11670 [Ignavibacteriota bacterium]